MRLPHDELPTSPSQPTEPIPARPPLYKSVGRRFRLLVAAALFALLAGLAAIWVARHIQPILRGRIVDGLAVRFHAPVTLQSFHVSIGRVVNVYGEGLSVPDLDNATAPNTPLLEIGKFQFHTTLLALLRSPLHIDVVHLTNLRLDVPPHGQRQEFTGAFHAPPGSNGKPQLRVDRYIVNDSLLLIESTQVDKYGRPKPPLQFDVAQVVLTEGGSGQPLHYDAVLTNPKPVGDIHSTGSIGPIHMGTLRDTAVSGNYTFDHADLSTIKGLGGVLSSRGQFTGTLGAIAVEGETDTPNFSLAVAQHAMPLHTHFHATVDGTRSNVTLDQVHARLLHTAFTASGTIERAEGEGPKGHIVELDMDVPDGHVEDLLKLFASSEPSFMNGIIRIKGHVSQLPGPQTFLERLRLRGNFQISNGTFAHQKTQDKVDALSMRSQGRAKQANPVEADVVASNLHGQFALADKVFAFNPVEYDLPGASVYLTGTYALDGARFDFHGRAHLQAHVSQTATGLKALLLKPLDPLFAKHGAGADVPVKFTGTKFDPKFGLDFHHKDDAPPPPAEKTHP